MFENRYRPFTFLIPFLVILSVMRFINRSRRIESLKQIEKTEQPTLENKSIDKTIPELPKVPKEIKPKVIRNPFAKQGDKDFYVEHQK